MGSVRQAGGARSGQVSGWWSESGADCGDSRGRQVGGVKRQQVRVGGVMRQMGGVRRGQVNNSWVESGDRGWSQERTTDGWSQEWTGQW